MILIDILSDTFELFLDQFLNNIFVIPADNALGVAYLVLYFLSLAFATIGSIFNALT